MKTAIYTRVSSERQVDEGFSLEAQHDILMDLIDKKGLSLYKVYSDPGVSGGSFKRPGIQMLIADMKAKKFDTLLIHKLDRLSRNIGDLYQFIDLINKLDVRLIIASQGSEEIDTRSPMGKAFLFFSGIWAHIYLDNLREETLKGQIKKAQKGGRHMSRPPLGYMHDSEYNLVIVEDEAKLVRTIYDMYLSGKGVTNIARHMNTISRGKEGGKWDNKSIRNIIENPTYAGFNHFKPEHWPESQRIITKGDHDPIVTEEEYKQAKSFRERRSNKHMSKSSYAYPFSGIVRCGKCGATYTGNSSTFGDRTYKGYRCYNNYARKLCDSPSISERELTQLVFNHIFITDDFIQEKEVKNDNGIDVQKEIEKSNRRRKNWMAALGDGIMSKEDYALAIDEEDERMKEVYELLEKQSRIPDSEIPLEELRNMILTVRDHWTLIEADTQKQFIQSVFRQITILKESEWRINDLLTV